MSSKYVSEKFVCKDEPKKEKDCPSKKCPPVVKKCSPLKEKQVVKKPVRKVCKPKECCVCPTDICVKKTLVTASVLPLDREQCLYGTTLVYTISLVNNSCYKLKNVLVTDTLGPLSTISQNGTPFAVQYTTLSDNLTISSPQEVALGKITDPCNTCLEPCSVSTILVSVAFPIPLTSSVGNVVVLDGCLETTPTAPKCPGECVSGDCDDSCTKVTKICPIVNDDLIWTRTVQEVADYSSLYDCEVGVTGPTGPAGSTGPAGPPGPPGPPGPSIP